MQLKYYTKEINFGDALNKLIFEQYIPELLDDNEEVILLGIGTVLGLEGGTPKTRKIVVFSSGYGFGDEKTYGQKPSLDDRYDIICVRGPLTAQKLDLDEKLAVTDGAILLKGIETTVPEKEYKWSYMPHHKSDKMYKDWESVVKKAGGNYISAINDPQKVIQEILKSEVLVTEAMHGAIVADVYRVPWIAVRAYDHINAFKWKDWLATLNLDYHPHKLVSLFGEEKIRNILEQKPILKSTRFARTLLANIYKFYQGQLKKKKAVRQLERISKQKPFLSDEKTLNTRYEQMQQKIEELKTRYS